MKKIVVSGSSGAGKSRAALELKHSVESDPVELPTFRAEAGFDFTPEQLKAIERESEAQYDLNKLALNTPT